MSLSGLLAWYGHPSSDSPLSSKLLLSAGPGDPVAWSNWSLVWVGPAPKPRDVPLLPYVMVIPLWSSRFELSSMYHLSFPPPNARTFGCSPHRCRLTWKAYSRAPRLTKHPYHPFILVNCLLLVKVSLLASGSLLCSPACR